MPEQADKAQWLNIIIISVEWEVQFLVNITVLLLSMYQKLFVTCWTKMAQIVFNCLELVSCMLNIVHNSIVVVYHYGLILQLENFLSIISIKLRKIWEALLIRRYTIKVFMIMNSILLYPCGKTDLWKQMIFACNSRHTHSYRL